MRKILYWLVSILILLFGLWSLVTIAVTPVINWVKVSGWESTPVTVERAEIIQIGHGSRYRKLLVEYGYRWNDVDHQGNRIAIYHESVSMPKKLQHSLQKKFSEQGIEHRAYVNPENPAVSVLRRNFYPGWYVMDLYLLLMTFYWLYGGYWVARTVATGKPEPVVDGGESIEDQKEVSQDWKFVAYFAGAFSLLGVGMVKMVVDHVREGDLAVLMFLVFPLVALVLWRVTWHFWTHRFDPVSSSDAPGAVVAESRYN